MSWGPNAEYRYGETGQKGDEGENIVETYCKSNNIEYEKKTDYHSQVVKKIDFIIDSKTVDVKTNIFKGWLAVEVFNSKGNHGWIYSSTAEEIYAVDRAFCSIYRDNTNIMREYVEKNKHRLKPSKNGAYLLWVNKDEDFIERLS